MIFLASPVEQWTDPGPFPVNKLARFFLKEKCDPRQPWVDQRQADAQRRQAVADEIARYWQQVEEFEAMLEEYQEQGEHMARMMPLYLHQLKISHKRAMQDRKSERYYERVDYVTIDHWYFDEAAYYFCINTWDGLPYGLSSRDFTEPEVAQTLSLNLASKCDIEINDREHERPGLWVIVEHRAGRGLIPKHVTFQKLFASLPKTAGPLAWPVGQAANGKVLYGNLAELYHLGIGGQTGGGKSNQINCMLGSFLSRNTPDDLRLFLVDFKRVEMALYKGLPHLGGDVPWVNKPLLVDDLENEDEEPILLHTVAPDYKPKDGQTLHEPMGSAPITDGRVLLKLLDYILSEIFRRLALMENRQIKKLDVWNKRNPKNKMSQWVLVVDELGDIMLQKGINARVESRLVRILQLGRAVGVRCILATQTPKSQVITSLIQNNLTAWVVTRTGNGPASGLMLDGKHDAAKLPPLPGRIIFRHAGSLTQVQTPEMTDLTIKNIVAQSKLGDVATLGESHQKIAPEEFFGYALRELSGYCGERELFEQFKPAGLSRKDVRTILKDYTVAGSPGHFEPEIEIATELYYLTPYIKGSNNPRQLVRDSKFTADYETIWAPHLSQESSKAVRRAPRASENTEQVTQQKPKIEPAPQINQPRQRIKLVVPDVAIKRKPEPASGDFPLAVVLDARQKKVWQAVKQRLGAHDDTQAMNVILDNVEVN